MLETPLIYTSKGNLPEASLRLEPVWLDTKDFTKLTLRYYLGDEVVKESAHVLSKQGIGSEAIAQNLV